MNTNNTLEKRFIDIFSSNSIINKLLPEVICESRDIFNARLNNLFQSSQNPLLTAVCGEIGNNSFDHNLGNWHDMVGVCFDHDPINKTIIIGDRGQGIRKTLY